MEGKRRGKRTDLTNEQLSEIFNTVKADIPEPFTLQELGKQLAAFDFPMASQITTILKKYGVVAPDGGAFSKGYLWVDRKPINMFKVVDLLKNTRKYYAELARKNKARKNGVPIKDEEAPKEEIALDTGSKYDKNLIPIEQAEMEAIKFLYDRGYRITKMVVIEQVVVPK